MWEYPEQYLDERCIKYEFQAEENRLLAEEFRDAAEFEARVATKLAQGVISQPCDNDEFWYYNCPYRKRKTRNSQSVLEFPCTWCRLKQVRLTVEDEMDADR